MHFCFRETCQKSFHSSCLRKSHWTEQRRRFSRQKRDIDEAFAVTRSIQLQRTLPESTVEEIRRPSKIDMEPDTPFDEIDLLESSAKKARGRPKKKSISVEIEIDPDNESIPKEVTHRLELIPTSLLWLAQSPMVKGSKTKLPDDTGIVVGNIPYVARARVFVANVLYSCTDLPVDWKKLLKLPDEGEGTEVESWIVPDEGLICPNCGGPI